jgi:hypothetical protein
MRTASHRSGESGVILLTTLLILMIVTALMAGFFAAVNSDVRATAIDRDQTQAYAVAHAGLEKLTSAVAQLFAADFSPNKAQILALNAYPPAMTGFEFKEPGGAAGTGYKVGFSKVDGSGNPLPEDVNGSNITSGPYQGMKGIITKYPITITARSTTGNSEVRLRRELQTVAVPVFQFGVFSETDLTFYAGDNFDFGGRAHTNGSLFLANLYGKTLKFTDRITAVKEIYRAHFSNGQSVASNLFTGDVIVPTAIGSPGRNLKYTSPNEASIKSAPLATVDLNTNWTSISTGDYKSIIRNGLTGAKLLNLPLVSQGATPIDIIRRPPAGEEISNLPVLEQRMYKMASLRILLSDRATDITTLPGIVTSVAPISLDTPAGYVVDATHAPLARAEGPFATTPVLKSSSSTSGSSPTMQLTLASSSTIPTEMRMSPTLQIGTRTITCTGKTATTFLGCSGFTSAQSISDNTPVAANSDVMHGTFNRGAPSTQTSGSHTATGGATPGLIAILTVDNTLNFTNRTFWLNSDHTNPTPPNSALVTCTGYSSLTVLTGCAVLGGIPAPSNYDDYTISSNSVMTQGAAQIGGFIKIEKQAAPLPGNTTGVWTDVTLEILNLGFADKNQEGTVCADPTPNAVIRLQRIRDSGGSACADYRFQDPYDYWANQLYDTREGNFREELPTSGSGSGMRAGGVMGYVTLDVANLTRWFAGTIPAAGATGNVAWNNNGYIVYFSDRRGDHNEDAATAHAETGEYGFEDFVNPANADGAPNNTLDGGPTGAENVNELSLPPNTTRETYGDDPATCAGCNVFSTTSTLYNATTRPWFFFTSTNAGTPGMARINRPVLFRRALKLVGGGIVSAVNPLPVAGLTVAAENPVYVQGNYNAASASIASDWVSHEPNRPAAIMADAVTLLSNSWRDYYSFRYPNSATTRDATTTAYRFAVVAGKGKSFPSPTAGTPHYLFGTDGGVGNFLRLLEDWRISGVEINYRGSMVSLYHSRQAVGTFKYGPNVYDYGDRNFTFDSDFLLPSLLPPGTPMFRDVNTLTFRQILRPTQ